MEITAVAPDSLWIKNNADSTYVIATTLANEVTPVDDKFVPLMVADKTKPAAGWEFYGLTGVGGTKVNFNGVYTGDQKFDDTDQTDWVKNEKSFFKDEISLMLEGQAGSSKNIYASARISTEETTPDAIWKAIHVAVVCDGVMYELDMGKTTLGSADYTKIKSDSSEILTSITVGEENAKSVCVFAWIDGADEDCKNSVAYNMHEFTIDLAFGFSAEGVTP
jgi:hypothetical protein